MAEKVEGKAGGMPSSILECGEEGIKVVLIVPTLDRKTTTVILICMFVGVPQY